MVQCHSLKSPLLEYWNPLLSPPLGWGMGKVGSNSKKSIHRRRKIHWAGREKSIQSAKEIVFRAESCAADWRNWGRLQQQEGPADLICIRIDQVCPICCKERTLPWMQKKNNDWIWQVKMSLYEFTYLQPRLRKCTSGLNEIGGLRPVWVNWVTTNGRNRHLCSLEPPFNLVKEVTKNLQS